VVVRRTRVIRSDFSSKAVGARKEQKRTVKSGRRGKASLL
jgi:hypothetical protein